MDRDEFQILDYGDAGVFVQFAESYSEDAWRRTHALASEVKERELPGITGIIPTYASVLIALDPFMTDPETVSSQIRQIIETSSLREKAHGESQCFKIPVLYGGEWGPDLTDVSAELGLSEEEVIAHHTSGTYRIRCLGSPVGQPLMSAPRLPGKVSRRETPRTRIPAGSVALAGKNTTIYTLANPGGWQLIGRSPIQFVDMHHDPPVPYRPGDELQFFRIEEKELDDYAKMRVEEMLVKR